MQKKRDTKAAAKKATDDAKKDKKSDIKVVQTSSKGGVLVDHLVPQAQNFQVIDDNGRNLSCYLMWSDIKNNHNKYYISQALLDNTGKHYLWTRYGRVGLDGVGSNIFCGGKDQLIREYDKKYRQKTGKGYTEVKMALGNPNQAVKADLAKKEEVKGKDGKSDGPKSKLDSAVQELLSFIFDMNLIEQSVVQIGYDVKRLPLGQLDKETVLEGYKYLREIEQVLNGKKKGDLADLSSKFYTYIPHNFSMKHMKNFTINTIEILKQKIDLIQNLIDIKVAHKIVNPKKPTKNAKHPLDEKYEALNCDLKTVDHKSEEMKMVEQYLAHTSDGRTLKLLDLFKVVRGGEDKTFNPNKLSNKKLLWHGSRFSNFGGILSQGLRIAPPEAPKTGYLFGKGVYFADLAGKSAPYCCANLSNNVGLFLLCEVAVGKPRPLYQTDQDADNLPKGFDCTQCIGRKIPNPAESKTIEKDIEVPYGKLITNPDKGAQREHNEFVVYNTNQIRMKYLCKVQFN
ncbi:poly(adp-ribose) polymerase [Stylonychia lemnae]|uniref:Poly [ADP-ribose] polymerase n=1 Tax=Stylonychia lemnae TaxID=5949 RepID=A0A078BER5_STYLE|nr:poly(adp-ribose) polymerase [Stylonychia lemnae]|eukprot:CDW91652.1 poly(adp-ribose) polymerase [Stylonychia lemnae]